MSLLERSIALSMETAPSDEEAKGARSVNALKERVQERISADRMALLMRESPGRARAEVRSACRAVFSEGWGAGLTAADLADLVERLLDAIFGLGPLEAPLEDETVTVTETELVPVATAVPAETVPNAEPAPVAPVIVPPTEDDNSFVNYRETAANYREFGERTPRDQRIVTAGAGSNMSAAIPPTIEEEVMDYEANGGYYPADRKSDEVTPWIEAFVNARKWIEATKK